MLIVLKCNDQKKVLCTPIAPRYLSHKLNTRHSAQTLTISLIFIEIFEIYFIYLYYKKEDEGITL